MMGYPPTPINEGSGIIPIACDKIFKKVAENEDADLTYKVEMSMMEIYMEKIRDLFEPAAGHKKLRNHPKKGPYVEGLSKNIVSSFEQVEHVRGRWHRQTALRSPFPTPRSSWTWEPRRAPSPPPT